MDNLYTETIYLSDIKAHIRIYKSYGIAEVYFYRNNSRLMYQAKIFMSNVFYHSVHVYRGSDDSKTINEYPQYVKAVCSAVSCTICAHNNSEIELW